MRYFSVYIKYIPSRQSRNMFITTWTKCLYRFLFIPFRSGRRGLSKRTIPLDYTSTKWKYKRFDISATFRWAGYPPKQAKLPKIASFLNILMLIVVRRSLNIFLFTKMKGDEPAMKYQKVLIFIAGSSLFICDLMIKVSNIKEIPSILTIDSKFLCKV